MAFLCRSVPLRSPPLEVACNIGIAVSVLAVVSTVPFVLPPAGRTARQRAGSVCLCPVYRKRLACRLRTPRHAESLWPPSRLYGSSASRIPHDVTA